MDQELQKRVAEFVEARGLGTDVAHRLLDLVSEIGEVSKEVKSTQYGKAEFHKNENWELEVARRRGKPHVNADAVIDQSRNGGTQWASTVDQGILSRLKRA